MGALFVPQGEPLMESFLEKKNLEKKEKKPPTRKKRPLKKTFFPKKQKPGNPHFFVISLSWSGEIISKRVFSTKNLKALFGEKIPFFQTMLWAC